MCSVRFVSTILYNLHFRDAGEYASARRFAQKSINLESTPEAVKLLQIINEEAASSSSKATGAEASASSSSTKSRAASSKSSENGTASEKTTYTEAQIKLVRRVRNCKVTDYYEILELEKTCEEGDVKKAYRKVCSCFISFFVLRLRIACSWRCNYILIKTMLQAPMKHSRVRFSISSTNYFSLSSPSGLQGFPGSLRPSKTRGIRSIRW